ncbi:MAG: hypothetical protein ACYS4T_15105, partial [Planctomycetota bacterium]
SSMTNSLKRANIVSSSGQYIPEAHRPLHAFSTTKSRLSTRDSEESTTMKLDIESQFETEIITESGQNGA